MSTVSVIYDLIGRDFASPAFRKAGDSAEEYGRKMGLLGKAVAGAGVAIAGAAVAIGVESVQAAVSFQASMEKIHTQAGAPQSAVDSLTKSVLALAPATQQGPEKLSEALFHLKSVGMGNADAMKALKTASGLAAAGGADLEATTNALAGAWRTGIRGATDFSQAAGTVNAIIGAGNMKMEDFVAAIGTGILPVAKTFGLSLQQVGAAMALMTDEGVPAVDAATRLRMSMSLLGAPSAAADKVLHQVGLSGLQLATAMRGPQGLIGAVRLLKEHLDASGLSAAKQSVILSRAFGGGQSDAAIMSMLNNLDVLEGKQRQINASAGKYGEAVAAQRKTAQAQFALLRSSADTLGIRLGLALLPPVTRFTAFLASTVAPVAVRLAGRLNGMFSGGFLGSVKRAGAFLAATFGPSLSALIRGVVIFAGMLAASFRNLVPVLAPLARLLAGIAGAGVIASFRALGALLANVIGPALVHVTSFVKGNAGVFRVLALSVLGVTAAVKAWQLATKGLIAVQAAWAAVTNFDVIALKAMYAWDVVIAVATRAWAIAQAALDIVLDANPIFAIVVAVAALGAGIYELYVHWSTVWAWIKKIAMDAWHFIADGWGKYLLPLLGPVGLLALGALEVYKHWKAIWGGIKKVTLEAWNAVYDHTIGVVIRLFDDIKKVVTGGFDGWWKTHGDEVKQVWKAAWDGVSKVFKVAWGAFTTIFKAEWALFSAAFRVGSAVITAIWKAVWGVLSEVFKVWWYVVSTEARIGWTVITAVFRVASLVITAAWKAWWLTVTTVARVAWDVIAAVFKVAFSVIEGIAKIGWDIIAAYVKVVWAGIKAVLKIAWDTIVVIFSVFLDLITGHWSRAWDDIRRYGQQAWNAIRGFFAVAWGAFGTLARQAWGHVRDTVTGAWNSIWSAARSSWNAASGWIRGITGVILGFFRNAGTLLYQAGKDVIQGLWNGLTLIWRKVTSWVASIAGWIKAHKGPLSLDQQLLRPAGEAIMSGFLTGLQSKYRAVTGFVSGVAGAVGSAFTGGGSVQALMRSMASALFGWSGAEWDALNYVEMREAGYNLTARNPSSGAYGLAQGITGPSWYYQWPGGNPNTAQGQIIAMLEYIKSRYGSPSVAAAHEAKFNWYGDGLDAMFSTPTIIGVGERGPEHVKVTPGPRRAGGGGNTYVTNNNVTVNVPATAHPAQAGKEVIKVISEYERVNGSGWRG